MQEPRNLYQYPVRNEMAKVLVALGGTARNGTLLARWSEAVPPEYFGNRLRPRQSWDAVKQKLFIECCRSMEVSGLIVRANNVVTLTEEGKKFAVSGRQPVKSWSAEEVKLFGRNTDERIASITGRSVEGVQHYRNEKKIPAFMPKYKLWTQPELDMLGTKTDQELSATLGRTVHAIRNRRKALGRPALLDKPLHVWSPEEIKQLGTMTDAAFAKKLGKSKEHVYVQRKKLGIPAYGKPVALRRAPQPADTAPTCLSGAG